MADVLALPLDLSAEGVHRLRIQLERDLAAGLDPGSRQAQIACLSGSLARSLHQLREAVGKALSEMPANDPLALNLRDAATGMTRIAEAVMAGAAGPGALPLPERHDPICGR
ncbi:MULTISPECIES: hypothetical protein [Methylobacterium]|uniref:hypothetical protein n=1 Tax=Methylobacterium TaxID=407 RepID=UPI0013EC5CA9|nr:hypothetical protein [Methylobacterium sp. DB0501]NGM34071.1 hypothetical protein [Methylobacterium sp. DB0501]